MIIGFRRQQYLLCFAFFLLITLASTGCKKDKKEELPPETQTGARTFGCLVNGEVLVPGGAQMSGGSLNCNYQLIDGEYYFRLVGRDYRDGNNRRSVGVFLYKTKIKENSKYLLTTSLKDSVGHGQYIKPYVDISETDSIYQGELFIKYLDTVKQIVSGTFWFDAINENGEVVQVREGRFDMRYTR